MRHRAIARLEELAHAAWSRQWKYAAGSGAATRWGALADFLLLELDYLERECIYFAPEKGE